MDQLTTTVRNQSWLQMIRARKESGLSVKQWCRENNISENCYYYRQQKLRQMAGEAISQFVEIQQPQAVQHIENTYESSAAHITAGRVVIGLNNNASEELILHIVRALNA